MEPSTELTAIETVAAFFQEGGIFMYIILCVFLTGFAIALERFIFLMRTEIHNKADWKAVFPLVSKGQFKKAHAFSQKSSSALSKIVSYGLSRLTPNTPADDIEIAMEEGLMEAIPPMERRTNFIATLANVATLLGLLGTIFGLISAFTAVADADPTEKANLLSSSISVAMNTTALGLMSAIPLLLAHSMLQGKSQAIVDSMEVASVKLLNMMRQARTTAQD